jgi:phage gpG-like protein
VTLAALEGLPTLDRQFADLPVRLLARLETKARDLAAVLAAKVREEKLSGQSLQTRSGALKASIGAEISVDGATVNATVGSFGDVKYAAIQEYGGRTAAHEILPAKAQALAFVAGGASRFARRVQHPGSTVPAHDYLLGSLDGSRAAIVAELASVANEAWSAS